MILKKINKKATQAPTEAIVFLVLNIFFFCALLFFVWRSTSESAVIEETTAKKLALILDGMKPNSEVNISLIELYSVIEKNKFQDFPIHIEGNIINVKVISGKGYSFQFFSDVNPIIFINRNDPNKILTIKT